MPKKPKLPTSATPKLTEAPRQDNKLWKGHAFCSGIWDRAVCSLDSDSGLRVDRVSQVAEDVLLLILFLNASFPQPLLLHNGLLFSIFGPPFLPIFFRKEFEEAAFLSQGSLLLLVLVVVDLVLDNGAGSGDLVEVGGDS